MEKSKIWNQLTTWNCQKIVLLWWIKILKGERDIKERELEKVALLWWMNQNSMGWEGRERDREERIWEGCFTMMNQNTYGERERIVGKGLIGER